MRKNEVIETDRGWKSVYFLAKSLSRLKPHVKVGVLDDGKAGSDTRGEFSNGELAVLNEFGSKYTPARPFVGASIEKDALLITADMKDICAALFDKSALVHSGTELIQKLEFALNLMGAKYSARIKNFVTQGEQIPPPNAPSTLRRKERLTANSTGSVRTLIDTGRMIGSISWLAVVNSLRDE